MGGELVRYFQLIRMRVNSQNMIVTFTKQKAAIQVE